MGNGRYGTGPRPVAHQSEEQGADVFAISDAIQAAAYPSAPLPTVDAMRVQLQARLEVVRQEIASLQRLQIEERRLLRMIEAFDAVQ